MRYSHGKAIKQKQTIYAYKQCEELNNAKCEATWSE